MNSGQFLALLSGQPISNADSEALRSFNPPDDSG
jgi:hypothetical protein